MNPHNAVLPTANETDDHLLSILGRGSVNLGATANTERLMLMMTRSCQLRCGYCWVEKTETGPSLPIAVAQEAIDWLMHSKRQKLEIQFFGGEPTTQWDTLLTLLNYARTHPNRNGRALEFIVTTNGIGMSEERARQLSAPDLLVLFSLDGDATTHRRFRPIHNSGASNPTWTQKNAWQQIENSIGYLNDSGVRWFMNAVVPPADAAHVMERYTFALNHDVPALQLNYAVGMKWPERRVHEYLNGLITVMRCHRKTEPKMQLYNWRSACEPVMLSDDLIVDVDGTVLHDGAIFLERGFPELRQHYHRHALSRLNDFDSCRWSLAQLCDVMCQAYKEDPEKLETVLQNIRMGAAVDWVIETLRNER